MKYFHHKITNFSTCGGIFERILGNILFNIGITKIAVRKNYLTEEDYSKFKNIIKPGDLILAGGHQRITSLFIRGIVTHSLLYIGEEKIIHASGDGVELDHYNELVKIYDTLIILHPKNISKEMILKTIDYAKQQLGKPFNFELVRGIKKFYCTQLVNNSYHHAGFSTGVINQKKGFGNRLNTTLCPVDFLKANFEISFLSHSLMKKNGKIILNHQVYKNRLFEYLINKKS